MCIKLGYNKANLDLKMNNQKANMNLYNFVVSYNAISYILSMFKVKKLNLMFHFGFIEINITRF